ncbi:hypothetical protein JTE90_020677 [Oedothorax gibbosus]|uniref:RNA helicase n=1 Tax=Oedothorax gibbosus TaxID=931172 RepID=A0AAV6V655_9ARAC|nr:hypothetical protein JTE90_020677 [Oedothorax gibbosus]
MVIQKPSISPQYLREEEICVSILEVKSPSHFIIKESPSQENSVAKEFFDVEHSMQNYYQSVAEDFLQVPRKDSVVVVKHKEKYYRAQVRSLFNVSHGDIFKVYLLDYGRECNVSREDLYLIHEQFLEYPFQAVELKLLDIEPISLIVDELYCSLDYGRVSTWDPSAIAFIEDLCKVMNNAYVKVKGVGENFLFGEFYIILENQKTLCLNEVLKEKKFAQAKEDFWDDVIPIGDFVPTKPNTNAMKDVPSIISYKSPLKLQSSECTSTPTSEAHSTEKSPSSSITRTPHSDNQLLSRSQKLKMLGKKAPSESPTSSTSLIVPNSNPTQVPNSLGDVNMNGSSNVNNESGKLIPPVAVLGSKTPPKIKVCGKAQLNKLKKLQALKKASPSPQKAPDSSTPLNNHSLPCHSSPSLSTQQSCRQIDGISPIQGASLDVTSLQKSETDLSSMKNDTNSLNVGFMNSTQPKDAKKNAEPSENEKSSSIDAISPNQSSSSKSFQKLKSLCRKKLPTSPQPESKKEPDEKTPTHPLGPSRETVSESETQMPKETDSESLSPKFVEEYPDGITDPIDSDDELESVLKPRRISVNDSGLSSDDCSRRSSISNDIMSDLQCVNDIDFSNKSLWEKQKVPALCIGEAIPTPVLSTGEASFPSALQKTLESVKFCGPSCIQSVVWPAVERRRCLAAIAPPHSGKTVAYLLPLVANFMSPLIHVNLPKANGPIVIIICSSWKKVQAVHDFFQLFLSGFKCKITCLFPGGHKRSKVIGMLNGCEILISVPSCLISFFKDEVICLKRCCHFILDDGSTLLSRNMPEIKELMYHFTKGIELRSSIPISLQIMICAERWSKAVSSFVDKFMHSPLLLFTSFLEAAVYANIPMHAHVCRDEDKKQKLLGMLEISKKIIICTDKSSTAFEIHDFLKCENVRSFLVNEEMEHYISDGVIQDWKSVRSAATPHCLILTDMCLNHLSISNANVLIHYDVPEVSRLQFGNRFSCIAEHFKNMENSPDCACHILVSENCSLQAPSLIKLVHRSGVAVPLELKDLSAKRTVVKKNNDAPLCHYMKSFGTCTLTNCPQRHHIDPECDKPSITPCEGDIAGLVTHVCDPTHLYVRLLQYLSPGLTSLSGTYAQVGFQLESFYKIEANRTRVKEPVVGRTYVLQDETGLFFRVKVLEIIPATLAQRQKMKLLFRDEGWVQSLDSCQLFEYISRDHFPPPLVVEVHLCGLRTPDTSLDWNPQARRYLTHLVEGKEIHGKIVLCLGETLWLHPAVLRERALHTHEYLNVLSLDKSLKDAEYAADNQKHLPMLIAACENKIPLPKEIKRISEVDETVEDEEQMIQYSYAFLELNVYENVFVSSVISPQEFYVQREKFVKCLDNLLESIEEKLKANKLEKCKTFLNGMHCLAPFQEDNSYYRAEVTEVIPDCGEVQVFFVDFGDFGRVSKDTLFAIPPKFLLLPFQAIKCELRGICAPHGGWTKKAGDTLYNLTRNEEGDMNILQIKAYEKTQQYSNGNHYIVDLWYEDKSISDQLLSAGLVCPAENSTSEKTAEEENGSAVDNLDATVVEVVDISPTVKRSPFQETQRLLNCMKSEPKRAKPFIKWWDTLEHVNIFIILRNIEIYELDMQDNKFIFSTTLRGMDYHTVEEFYSSVHSSDAIVKITSDGLKIIFKKQTSGKWPHLTKTKFSHIKYDLDHIDVSDSEEMFSNEVSLAEMEKPDENLIAHYDSEESNSSEDDDYVQTWRKMAQFRDPHDPWD